jgi:hypothetical protein
MQILIGSNTNHLNNLTLKNMKIHHLAIALLCTMLLSCKNDNNTKEKDSAAVAGRKLAKFEPADGEVILFVGQENDAIGGTVNDTNGYFDHFRAPGGFTMYTDIMPGLTEKFEDKSFTYTGLNGIYQTDDWGDSLENMSLCLSDVDFNNSALAIGLAIIDNEKKIAEGKHDKYIKKLGDFCLSLGKRPVFLRIGFEFDGPWNRYEKEAYKKAFRRIKDNLSKQGVTNVAYVWQSKGFGMTVEDLEEWYPGDEYVDWCGYSFFHGYKDQKITDFAEKKVKPVFICEATPTSTDWKNDPKGNTGLTKQMILSNPEEAKMAWEEWFTPFFKTINDNPKTIKAISYINANWRIRPRWKANGTFKNIDARLQLSDFITKKWNEETNKDKYLKASPELFDKLYNNNK